MRITKERIRDLLVFCLLAFGVYQGNVLVQSHLGRQAIEDTGLVSLSLAEALPLAAETGRPVLVQLSAVWCPTCRSLDRQVLSDAAVRARIEEGYHFVRLEYESEEGEAFMARHGVRGFPLLFLVDAEGEIARPLPLTMDPRVFEQRLTEPS